jgi:hypothetical protein
MTTKKEKNQNLTHIVKIQNSKLRLDFVFENFKIEKRKITLIMTLVKYSYYLQINY